MALELWIPPSAKRPVWKCSCGKTYEEHEQRQFIRHIETCDEHDKHVQAELEETDLISGPISDQEAWEWGRKRMAEGKVGFRRGRPA